MGQVRNKNLKNLKLFGSNLQKIRIARGWSQEELAFRTGISYSSINTIESGKLNTTLATCFELAKALEVPAKDLFDF